MAQNPRNLFRECWRFPDNVRQKFNQIVLRNHQRRRVLRMTVKMIDKRMFDVELGAAKLPRFLEVIKVPHRLLACLGHSLKEKIIGRSW